MPYFMDEVGRKMRIDTGINLTGNTEITVKVTRPDDTSYEVTRVAVADITVDDAATGQISYETELAYHNQVGEYFANTKVEGVPNSSDIVFGPIVLFTVEGHTF